MPKVDMVELRQLVNDENTFEYIETPTKRPVGQELIGVSAKKKCRVPLVEVMNSNSSNKQTIRKPRYDERVASANGSQERAERFKKNAQSQDEFMRVLKYSADKTANKLKNINLRTS